MDLCIVKESENKTLERTELAFEVENAVKTPSRQELRKRIAALKNSREELVSIDFVKQCFGEHRAKGKAFVYADIERLKRTEPKYLLERESKEKKKKEGKEKPKKGELAGKGERDEGRAREIGGKKKKEEKTKKEEGEGRGGRPEEKKEEGEGKEAEKAETEEKAGKAEEEKKEEAEGKEKKAAEERGKREEKAEAGEKGIGKE